MRSGEGQKMDENGGLTPQPKPWPLLLQSTNRFAATHLSSQMPQQSHVLL